MFSVFENYVFSGCNCFVRSQTTESWIEPGLIIWILYLRPELSVTRGAIFSSVSPAWAAWPVTTGRKLQMASFPSCSKSQVG